MSLAEYKHTNGGPTPELLSGVALHRVMEKSTVAKKRREEALKKKDRTSNGNGQGSGDKAGLPQTSKGIKKLVEAPSDTNLRWYKRASGEVAVVRDRPWSHGPFPSVNQGDIEEGLYSRASLPNEDGLEEEGIGIELEGGVLASGDMVEGIEVDPFAYDRSIAVAGDRAIFDYLETFDERESRHDMDYAFTRLDQDH